MSRENMFEIAVRNKLRFPFKGQSSVEDLWDLSPEDLDIVFKSLNSQVRQAKEESLLQKKSKEDETLELQIEIVKYIVSVKVDEANARLVAKDRKEQRQKIQSILYAKQEQELNNKTPEELQAMLSELE